MRFKFLIWGRETQEGRGILLGELWGECRADVVAEARTRYRTRHLDVVSQASWDLLSPKMRSQYIGNRADYKPTRVRDHPDGYRFITCRMCNKPVIFHRDQETGEWPETYLPYHTGACQDAYNQLQIIYRQRRKAKRK